MNHPVIVTLMILAIIAFMYFAAEVLRPLALALLLSLVLAPLVGWLQRRGLPRVPAVVLTVILALGTLGGVGFVVIQQLSSLANDLAENRGAIEEKLSDLVSKGKPSTVNEIQDMLEDVSRGVTSGDVLDQAEGDPDEAAEDGIPADPVLAETPEMPGAAAPIEQLREAPADDAKAADPVKVEVVDVPTIQDRFSTAVGPLMEPATIFGIVFVLTLFMLITKDDLLGRVIQVIGLSHISLTTRTMAESGQRISYYLMTFSFYNAICGVILGFGLFLIGVPYSVLWGFLVAVLRFIPYVGPMVAFVLPLGYSFAFSDGWFQPLMVVALFVIFEAISEYVLEPILYGRTTGITAVGLLIAAMFWTWLWGAPGLLLATPLTVCLAVLGKYVPALRFFATMLGEEAILDRHARYYQRLLARDQDGAVDVVEEAEADETSESIYDEILIPALSRAERDLTRGAIDEDEQSFIWHVTRCLLDDLDDRDVAKAKADEAKNGDSKKTRGKAPRTKKKVLGIASEDVADALALRMLAMSLRDDGVEVEIMTEITSAGDAAEQVGDETSCLVILSHLPPVGLSAARRLVKSINARWPDIPLWVGRWKESANAEKIRDRLTSMGADRVVLSITEARSEILQALELGACPDESPKDLAESKA